MCMPQKTYGWVIRACSIQEIRVTFEDNSFVPAWTTLAADYAAEAATMDRRPKP